MGRSRGGGGRSRAPARRAPPPAPARSSSQGGGMMSGLMGTVAQGFAFGTGSSLARNAVDSMLHGSSDAQEVPAHQQQPQQGMQPAVEACSMDKNAFVECLNNNAGNVSSCDFYYQALQMCQNQKM